jgi:hypothetical protein
LTCQADYVNNISSLWLAKYWVVVG